MTFKYEIAIDPSEEDGEVSAESIKDRIEEALRNEGLESAVLYVTLVAEYD